MAGLIGNVGGAFSGGLMTFLQGSSAATSSGHVEQFRNALAYDYGDILNGASSKGTIFDIRVNSKADYEFGPNLSFKTRVAGIIDSGDALVMEAAAVRERLEQNDVSRQAFALLLASKGEITQDQLNDVSAYGGLFVLDRETALDRMNIDVARPFRVNGVQFELFGEEFRITSRPGEAQTNTRKDAELTRLRRALAQKQEALPGGGDLQKVDVAGFSINQLIAVREDLESRFQYVAYDFAAEEFVGSNSFNDIVGPLSQVPDSFFFGANMAYQLEHEVGSALTQAEKNEIFPATLNYFASLVLGALTGLPGQLKSEHEAHSVKALTGLLGDEAKALDVYEKLRPTFENMVQNMLDAVSVIEPGADVTELRKGLGITFSGGSYSVQKYTS